MIKKIFSVVFFIMFFLSGNIYLKSENIYQGKIVGQDKSKIEDIKFNEQAKKDEIQTKEAPTFSAEEKFKADSAIENIPSKIEANLKIEEPDTAVKIEATKNEDVKLQKNIEVEPEKPKKFKYILLSILGFFIILAAAS